MLLGGHPWAGLDSKCIRVFWHRDPPQPGVEPEQCLLPFRPHQIRAGVPHGTYFGQCWSWSQRQVTLLLGIVYETIWNTNSHCDAYNIRITVLFQPLTSWCYQYLGKAMRSWLRFIAVAWSSSRRLVEMMWFEHTTYCLQGNCSTKWATSPSLMYLLYHNFYSSSNTSSSWKFT